MPLRFLRPYLAMLPRLQAEQSLAHVAELQAADSFLDATDRQPIVRAWQRTAQPEPPRQTKEEFMAQMAAIGFKVVV